MCLKVKGGATMARPAKNAEGPSARERMIAAFWKLLEKDGYDAVTIQSLCYEARVSPNTLYYHFKSREEIARTAFEESPVPKLIAELVAGVSGEADAPAAFVSDCNEGFSCAALLAKSGSKALTDMLAGAFRGAWLEARGVAEDELTDEQRLDVAFAANGIVGALAEAGPASDPQRLSRVLRRHLAQ